MIRHPRKIPESKQFTDGQSPTLLSQIEPSHRVLGSMSLSMVLLPGRLLTACLLKKVFECKTADLKSHLRDELAGIFKSKKSLTSLKVGTKTYLIRHSPRNTTKRQHLRTEEHFLVTRMGVVFELASKQLSNAFKVIQKKRNPQLSSSRKSKGPPSGVQFYLFFERC
jgi:hypothetical protein